ncbi:hypothetical protein [Pseudomonas baetica]|uniref:hypothetical protein n=1 Tax=Pseudomonas baetica TaxID=674054 RepID=UPI002405EA27|nr:hypothetical protein [Pseudomonas baetica]MDF9774332.1 hypothetical protein [Pseudomonas baetica]
MNKLINRLVLGSALCGFASLANAAVLDVQAEIRPDPINPGIAEIINNTPVTGYCTEYPGNCNSRGIRSDSFPIVFTSSGGILKDQVIPFGFPATWRTFTVSHSSVPGETAEIQIRIAGVGTRYSLSSTARAIIGAPPDMPVFDTHAYLWQPSWAEATAPCQQVNATSQGADPDGTVFTTFWLTPQNVTTCSRSPKYNIPGMSLQRLDVHYELRAVRPEQLISGDYHGSYTYSTSGDFDMGALNPNDGAMTFNLNLAVKQDVNVKMSADSVALAPKGGWMEWITHGRKPEKILGDLRFFILTSSPFKMDLSCSQLGVGTCLISNGTHEVPVDISVSLPSPWVDGVGQPVVRRPLTIGGAGLEHLKPAGLPTRQPSLLHFEVPQDSVATMHDDSSYRGTVNITFDSDI